MNKVRTADLKSGCLLKAALFRSQLRLGSGCGSARTKRDKALFGGFNVGSKRAPKGRKTSALSFIQDFTGFKIENLGSRKPLRPWQIRKGKPPAGAKKGTWEILPQNLVRAEVVKRRWEV